MSDKTQAMGSTVHTNHQLGGDGERVLVQCFKQKFIPGSFYIFHTSHLLLHLKNHQGTERGLSVS